NAKERNRCLDWLKADQPEDVCRILTNARCLSEGVDVPALDAILFMHPRKSQIDVVQSVGRVMRRAEGKKMGYVILPIGVPAGMSPEDALNDNERYRVVWQILNALRSHDERFDAMINKMDLGVDVGGQIEVIAVSNKLPNKADKSKGKANIGHGSAPDDDGDDDKPERKRPDESQIEFVFDEFSKAIMAKIVKKCGRRDYWENWASDIAKIAQTHITRITALVQKEGTAERKAFREFLAEIRDDLNESISESDAVEMLAQHIITKPVFEALFEDHSFAKNNPVSVAMQGVLDILDEQNLEKESESLNSFYESVRRRASGIDSPEAKQRIIVELYDKFFRTAFPRMTEKLGIVYTPVEVVDFIIRSVDEVLRSEFGQNLGSEGVHIIDPFTGTGTFITRLLQSGLISREDIKRKYSNEIHANEIVLLAYYIAAINIEATYSGITNEYAPFGGICLTDTFQLYEQDRDLISEIMADNSSRRMRQKSLDIRVIIGNPPYSVGQSSANDDSANSNYPKLDERIRETYAANSSATNLNALYDSYIRAVRWASDRIGDSGIVSFVTNAGWIDGNSTDGLRKSLAEEFSDLYIFHLRGNQRTSGEQSRREGGKIFGSGSRAPIAIWLFVKNPSVEKRGNIYVHDIGDYLSQADKLARISMFGSIGGISAANGWTAVTPDTQNDWVKQRDESFDRYIRIGNKDANREPAIFSTYSRGIETGRDAWVINSSIIELRSRVRNFISFYNSEIERLTEEFSKHKMDWLGARSLASKDSTKISWTRSLLTDLAKRRKASFQEENLVQCVAKPFTMQWLYFDDQLNHERGQLPRMFPEKGKANRVIWVTGVGASVPFSCFMSGWIPSREGPSSTQTFPLYLYPRPTDSIKQELDLDDTEVRDGITDAGLSHFKAAYPEATIMKEDVFHYVYGILHSESYRAQFQDNLSKQLPRIPLPKKVEDFWQFVRAGESLADLHVDFETVEPYPVTIKEGDLSLAVIEDEKTFYRVEKMKFGGKRPKVDKATVIYNPRITMTNIPIHAYDYIVNGKSALEWVMERQVVKTDKDSGIVNDANRYAVETVGDPAYPLKLFQRVITVSLETMKIVRSLPALDIMDTTKTDTAQA
ncbi:damage-inducible protein, partial [Pseudomonas sp. HMWF010]